jgi:hypothetical protein
LRKLPEKIRAVAKISAVALRDQRLRSIEAQPVDDGGKDFGGGWCVDLRVVRNRSDPARLRNYPVCRAPFCSVANI